jgi:hypothetical protein
MPGFCRIWPGQGGNDRPRGTAPPIPMTSQRRFTRVTSRALPQMRLAKPQGATMALPPAAQRLRAASQAGSRGEAGPPGAPCRCRHAVSRRRGPLPSRGGHAGHHAIPPRYRARGLQKGYPLRVATETDPPAVPWTFTPEGFDAFLTKGDGPLVRSREDDTPVLMGQSGPRRRATTAEMVALIEELNRQQHAPQG